MAEPPKELSGPDLEAARKKLLAGHKVNVTTHALDLAVSENARKLGEACRDVDILVNNAGAIPQGTLTGLDEKVWRESWDLKVYGYINLARAIYAAMCERRRGVIVNIVDVHSQRPLRDHPVYGPAKAGLAMLTRSLAKDLGPDVRVNGVSPGAILWPDEGQGMSDTLRAAIIRQTALKRAGAPEDIAAAVLFLVRDAPYVTGQIIAVDGGRSVGW